MKPYGRLFSHPKMLKSGLVSDPFIEESVADPVIMTASLNPKVRNENPVKKAARKCCTKKMLKRKLPIVEWLPRYKLEDLKGDFIAGVTVGLTVIPQAIAYAGIASLPPQYGLYASFMGAFTYIFLGGIESLSIGPTAIMSLLTSEYVEKGGANYAIVLCFLSGCVQLLMGALNLGCSHKKGRCSPCENVYVAGFLVTFISSPVISAFTSAAAIIIAASQLKNLFGLKFTSHSFVTTIYNVLTNITDTNLWDLSMGIIALKQSEWPKHSVRVSPKIRKPLGSTIWIICTAKNAIAILLCVGVALAFIRYDIGTLSLTGEVHPGIPPFKIPPFHYNAFNNVTNQTVEITFIDICEDLGAGLILIPLISVLESIAIAKVFDTSKKLDATQEMITLGVANIASSFFSSFPITGSFSSNSLESSFLLSGVIVLIALGVLSPYFKYIPKSALSAMILVAVIFMVHFGIIISLWKVKKSDLVPYFITFFSCLGLGLKYGMLIGIGMSVLILLYHHACLHILVQELTICNIKCLRVQPDRGVFYPSSENMQKVIKKRLKDNDKKDNENVIIIFDAIHIQNADYTTMSDDLFNLFKLIEVTELRISRDPYNVENMIKDALSSQKIKGIEADDIKIITDPEPTQPSENL
ncbi:Sodium-independent sulfate anion transporter [Nymphon striatum]|nr:Sodium-independent sulfate anion transporter [Nymphon striatum]